MRFRATSHITLAVSASTAAARTASPFPVAGWEVYPMRPTPPQADTFSSSPVVASGRHRWHCTRPGGTSCKPSKNCRVSA